MKRWMIWTICLTMGVCFVVLLYLQIGYVESMIAVRREQFTEGVLRSLDATSRDMERNETMVYLRELVSVHGDSLDLYSSSHATEVTMQGMGPLRRRIRNAYIYRREVLDEVIFRVLYASSELEFEERIDRDLLLQSLRRSLASNGINLKFHYRIFDSEGREVARCADYEAKGEDYSFSQTLFRNDASTKMGVVCIHFPEQNRYIMYIDKTVYLALLFTLFLFVTFLITVYLVVRQKKVTEMKNDFINNMTHEFKTPISTISIAAQMLSDSKMPKTPETYERLGGVIYGETKRLRLQVEKVLQMSLYERGNIAMKLQMLNANTIIDSVIQTFNLKVSQNGGCIDTRLDALNPDIYADDMHFTNVIFNLMDNAVKYKRDDVSLHLAVSTWNTDGHLCIQITDNGIGIPKDDQKRIFEKFYRVHSGNTHNVKGFGLGLAYVHKMIHLHHGTIKVTSELGKGTTFLITLPLAEDND